MFRSRAQRGSVGKSSLKAERLFILALRFKVKQARGGLLQAKESPMVRADGSSGIATLVIAVP